MGNLASLADPGVVSQSLTTTGRHSSPSTSEFVDFASRCRPHTPTGSKVSFSGNVAIRRSFEDQGLSPAVAEFLLKSWRESTQLQYGTHIDRWMSVCLGRKIDPFQPPLHFLLDYLLQEFNKVSGRSYSSMNSIRSAISAIASIEHMPIGRHPLVCRFMKAVFQIRPSFPRSRITWDPELVLTHIDSLGGNAELSTIQLSRKLVMLMLLLSGQRGQTLHLLDIRNMSVSISRVSFRIGDPLKTSRPGDHLSELTFDAYALNQRLCVCTTVRNYLTRTSAIRGSNTRFFLTSRPPFKVASRDT